jgi:hypothetical protein
LIKNKVGRRCGGQTFKQKEVTMFIALAIIILAILLIPETGKGAIDDDFNKTRSY